MESVRLCAGRIVAGDPAQDSPASGGAALRPPAPTGR